MTSRRVVLAASLSLLACTGEEPTLPDPVPPPPSLATLWLGDGSRHVRAFVGGQAPDDVVTIALSGTGAALLEWTATSRGSWSDLLPVAGVGPGSISWGRSTSGLSPGLHVDTIEVRVSGAIGSPARLIDTLEILATPTTPTLLAQPASFHSRIVRGDTATVGRGVVSVAPPPGDPAPWCVRGRTGLTSIAVPAATSLGHCDAAAAGAITWQRDVVDLPVGLHVDTLLVTRPGVAGAPAMILDSITILPGPGPLTLTAAVAGRGVTVPLGEDGPADSVDIVLAGRGAATTPWVATRRREHTTLVSGIGEGSGKLRWRRATAALAAGIYYDTLSVSAIGARGTPVLIVDTVRVLGPALPAGFSVPASAWAGGHLPISSESFRNRGIGAALRIGAVTVLLEREDETTMVAPLPGGLPGGAVTPVLFIDGFTVTLPSVFIAGYTGAQTHAQTIGADTYTWPRTGRASVMGQTQQGIALFDLEAGTIANPAVPTNASVRGPGPTPQDSVFLLRNGTSIQAWRLGPSPAWVATYDDFYNLIPRQMMLLSENVMLWVPGQHLYRVATRSAPGAPFDQGGDHQAEEVEGVYLSPRKDRGTVRVDHIASGIPVFDAATGQAAYTVTGLVTTYGVDFSADGALLALGGRAGTTARPPRVLLLDAATGTVLADTLLDREIFAVAFDPDRPLLYVGVVEPGVGPVVLVLDRATFALRGEMRAPGPVESASSCCYRGVIALNRDPAAMHVFWFRWSWRFALAP